MKTWRQIVNGESRSLPVPSFVRKIQTSIERRGVLATLELVVSKPLRRLQIRCFDRVHRVKTTGIVELGSLRIDSSNLTHGTDYVPTPPWVFRRMLRRLQIRYEDWVFVDLGSGKGRTLLLASEFPFRRVTGVEFSPELNRIAEQNIRNFRSGTQRCKLVESICADAATYPLPHENTVVYFFFSFRDPVMEKVLANIHSSLTDYPREFRIINFDPVPGNLLERDPALQAIKRTAMYLIYAIKNPHSAS
jgi:SAM-dependent methyltransferase